MVMPTVHPIHRLWPTTWSVAIFSAGFGRRMRGIASISSTVR